MTVLAALLLGLGMAAFSIRQILKLEAREKARFEEVAGARAQLTDLSAKLVQAQETERRALSRELHDEVGQSLSAVLIELRNLSAGLGMRNAEQSRAQVEEIKSLVESTIGWFRNMALLLRPSMLDDLGLIPALRWQAREISKRTSMDVIVTAELTSDDLPDDYKTCIYRVVQEALHNCARHSNAGTVRVRVQQAGGRITLSIQDDGLGFDTAQMKGLGLLRIQEQVNRLGAGSAGCIRRRDAGRFSRWSFRFPPAGLRRGGPRSSNSFGRRSYRDARRLALSAGEPTGFHGGRRSRRRSRSDAAGRSVAASCRRARCGDAPTWATDLKRPRASRRKCPISRS